MLCATQDPVQRKGSLKLYGRVVWSSHNANFATLAAPILAALILELIDAYGHTFGVSDASVLSIINASTLGKKI